VEKLSAWDQFSNVSYSGYSVSSISGYGTGTVYIDEISITLKEVELPTEAETEGDEAN
jgi:hypothetical protein